MVNALTALATLSSNMFNYASGFIGLFFFLLMVLTGWTEREKRPIASQILMWGGLSLSLFWTLIQFFS